MVAPNGPITDVMTKTEKEYSSDSIDIVCKIDKNQIQPNVSSSIC